MAPNSLLNTDVALKVVNKQFFLTTFSPVFPFLMTAVTFCHNSRFPDKLSTCVWCHTLQANLRQD